MPAIGDPIIDPIPAEGEAIEPVVEPIAVPVADIPVAPDVGEDSVLFPPQAARIAMSTRLPSVTAIRRMIFPSINSSRVGMHGPGCEPVPNS